MKAEELINLICPEHGRTSCSDKDIFNGFYSRNELGYGRCTRCILLEIANGEEIPSELRKEAKNGDIGAFCG